MAAGNIQIYCLEGNRLLPQSISAKTLHSNDGLQTAGIEMEGDKQISQRAVKGAHSMTGLQTDGAKVELKAGELQRGSESSEDTYILQGKDAALACHFFENELIEMDNDCGCQTVRLPAAGIPDTVTIKCIKPYMKNKSEGLFQKMKSEIQSFSFREVQFSEDQYRRVNKFIKENTNEDVLLYCNPKENQAVAIFSKNSSSVSNVCHKLKVELGIIKPTGRRGRELTLESDGNMSGTGNFGGRSVHDSPSGGIYPDLSSVTEYSDTDFDFRLGGNLLVKVYKGSITRVKVDAIVNAANESLHHAGGVARVIEDAAGHELTAESRNYIRRNGDLKVGGICLTTAGRMPYRSVMHVVGPQWHMYSDKSKCLRDLYATICAVLLTADKEEYGKIAMPAISAGIFGVPKELCTDMYVRAAVKYSEDRKTHQTFLKEFHIVDVDTEILQDIRASWEKWQKNPKAMDPERAADEYAKKRGSCYQSHGQGRSHKGHRQWATSSSSMESADFDVTLGRETLSAFKVVDMGKEEKLGHKIQKFQLGQELVIKIYKGSLVNTLQLDALVTSISTKGEKGHLGKLVEEAGGTLHQRSFDDEKRKKYFLKPGEIFKCKSGNINVGCIINVVIDRLQSVMGSELNTYNYRLIIKTFLKNVNDLKDVKTMVMPLLGSGSLKVPSDDLDRCCSGFVQAVLDFSFDWKEPNIKEIHIVNTDENVCTSVEKAFRSMSVSSSSGILDERGKLNRSASRRQTEETMGIYNDKFNAGSSSENWPRSVSGSSFHGNYADPFDELATSRANVHRNSNLEDRDEQISDDEDADDNEDNGNATSTSKPNPPEKRAGNLNIITS
ncbi:hypothetical protein CHS0354_006127 [Potamilus streckersoni]|uniref:Macro domain-containing protein n=1 Tax=Potamilus streckersoni TaxID=2493646 RepID=A0AAE0SU10_9BIVA|nr:hypothetical protein CHS0354_006127 [Potamilus streckersoni]